jgi:ABC-2 type transport system permease protein
VSSTTSPATTAAEPAVVSESTLRAALSTRVRPSAPSSLAASVAFGWRAMLKIKHVPMQLFDVTMFPIMFTLLFTYLFGGALAGSPRVYIQDLLPGILVMTVVMITMYTGMALNTDISKGVFDRFRSLPIWRPAVLVGMMLADAVRYTMAALVVTALGVIIGFRPDGGVMGVIIGFRPDGGVMGVAAAIGLLLVFSSCLSWVWSAIGMKMQTPETVMQMSMTVLFPLTFASNVFVDPSTMPGWLQAIVNVNPISHLTTASRELMHGTMDSSAILYVLLWSAGLVAVFAPLTMRLYHAER